MNHSDHTDHTNHTAQSLSIYGGARHRRITVRDIQMAKSVERWPMLTAYEQFTAEIFDECGIPLLLVGDSAASNFLGYENTIAVTVDELVPLARAVVRSTSRAMVIADLPFGSYESSPEQALATAIRFMKESGVHGVKLEGGERVAPQIRALVSSGIPVMAHIGLTPQSLHQLGGYRVQGRGDDGAILKASAHAVQEAGAFALVLELIPATLATEITQELTIPTIGIGAGNQCDAQVLVWSDLMGLTANPPKLAKAYRNLRKEIHDGVNEWAADVATGTFPGQEQSFQ